MGVNMKSKHLPFYIFLVGLITRLVVYPFTQVTDADSVSRVNIAIRWLDHPEFIWHGMWLPIHHYLNAFAIFLTGSTITGPIVFHILLASATAFPIYGFTKREFGQQGAWFVALIYVLNPVVFKNSFQALSGVPYAFFLACTLNYLSLLTRTQKLKYAVLAGLMITLASGFRYEAWLLIAVFTGMLLAFKSWKGTVVFWLFAMIFPAAWMIGNYLQSGDMFTGLSGAYNWNILMEGVNDQVSKVEKWERLIFFPYSWFLLFSPLLLIPLGLKVWKNVKMKKVLTRRLMWAIPFVVVMIAFIYKSYEGTLLKQHRFTISLIALSIPFAGVWFENMKWKTWKRVGVALVVITYLPMAYFWMKVPINELIGYYKPVYQAIWNIRHKTDHSFRPIPRLYDQDFVKLSTMMKNHLTDSSTFITDFMGWEPSYYLALESGLHPNSIFIAPGAKHAKLSKKILLEKVDLHTHGVIVLKCGSRFMKGYENFGDFLYFDWEDQETCLSIQKIWSKDPYAAFAFERMAACPDYPMYQLGTEGFDCPTKNGIEHFRKNIVGDSLWLESVKAKAIERDLPLEQMIIMDAKWMRDHQNVK